jgi:hypothetical protein
VWTASVGGSVRADIRITGSTAASDVIACASGAASSVNAATDYVEFVQLDGAGETPAYLEHATYVQPPPTGYGMKCRDLAVGTALGVSQLVKNAWMRTWTNGANPPDDWAVDSGGGAGALARNTNTDFIRYGPYSWSIDFYAHIIKTARLDVVLTEGNRRISARAQLYFTTFSGSNLTFRISALNADGTIGATLASTVISSAATGAWVTMEILAVDIGMHQASYGMCVNLQSAALGTGVHVGYLDTIEVYGFLENPETIYEFGDATALHQVANRQLVANGSPPIAYELSIADMERAEPAAWSRNALTIGGNVRVVDSDFGIDTTVRLLRLERDLLRPKASSLALSTLPALLTQIPR